MEDKPAWLFDDGPDLPEGWEPLEPGEYDVTCDGCGGSRTGPGRSTIPALAAGGRPRASGCKTPAKPLQEAL